MTAPKKILIYDDECPLCTWYSSLFVKYKLLEPQGRLPFSKIEPTMFSLIDVERSRDEIPLIDIRTGKVFYGIDSLLEILSQKMPLIKWIGNQRLVKWFLLRLYRLITYNRKVIVARRCGQGKFDCAPSFNVFYRLLFMILFFVFNTLMLAPLQQYILNNFSFYHQELPQLQTSHLVLVAINCTIALLLNPRLGVEYLGQVNMLALITVLLLIPLVLINSLIWVNQWFNLLYLLCLTLFVVKEYFRRMRYAGIVRSGSFIVPINLACITLFVVYLFA